MLFYWTRKLVLTCCYKLTLGTSGYGDVYEYNKCVFGSNQGSIYNLGACTSSGIGELIPHFENNQLFAPNATISIKCGSNTWTFEEAQKYGIDIGTIVKDLPDDDQVLQWGRELLGL